MKIFNKNLNNKKIEMRENDNESISNVELIKRDSKFENSLEFNSIIKSVEQFFECPSCIKLIKNAIVCENCLKLFCYSCSQYFMSCPNCMICPFKQTRDPDIDYVIKKLFKDDILIKENLNFSILLATDLNTLYNEKGIKNLIKGEEDFDNFSLKSRQSMIENLSNLSFSSEFESIDEYYTYINLFDIIEKNGKLMKKEIEETKINEPEKYIEIDEALSNPPNSDLFISGLLAKHLNNEGVNVAIERQISKSVQDSIMNLLTTGLYKGKIIQIRFDYGKKINNEILTNDKLRNNFIKSWLAIISSKTKIKENNLYYKSISPGTVSLSLISLENIEETELEKIKNAYKEIKEIEYRLLLEGCIISPEMFDTRWNNRDGGWARKGEKRGGREYDPPYGWIGYGLNVLNKYDNNNNKWLGMRNIEGEWWVAYHGNILIKNNIKIINKNENENEINNNINNDYKNDNNINELSKKEYSFVGIGLYLTEKIDDASEYSGIIEHLNHRYKITFMCRVCPNKVRISKYYKNYFVVDPNENCVRPYRILLKEINNTEKSCSLF